MPDPLRDSPSFRCISKALKHTWSLNSSSTCRSFFVTSMVHDWYVFHGLRSDHCNRTSLCRETITSAAQVPYVGNPRDNQSRMFIPWEVYQRKVSRICLRDSYVDCAFLSPQHARSADYVCRYLLSTHDSNTIDRRVKPISKCSFINRLHTRELRWH